MVVCSMLFIYHGLQPVAPGHEIVLFISDSRPHAPVLLGWSDSLLQA